MGARISDNASARRFDEAAFGLRTSPESLPAPAATCARPEGVLLDVSERSGGG